MAHGHSRGHLRHGQQAAKVQAFGFPVLYTALHVEQVGAAHQVFKLVDAQLGHDLAHFFGDEEKVVHDMLGLAGEFRTQSGVLRGNTHRTGVQVALAHHDAALDHQRCGGEAEFVRAQQCANGHITTGLHLTVGLHADASTQAVEHQGLLGFGQADFPG